jgi:hypothetical protein
MSDFSVNLKQSLSSTKTGKGRNRSGGSEAVPVKARGGLVAQNRGEARHFPELFTGMCVKFAME